ncbi:MAG: hypothetical protein VX265_00660, partial [Myxococcota bacterium]|nr:hypothetical protein [Myxococcota bacterium]
VGSEAVIYGESHGLEYYRLQEDPGMHQDLAAVDPERAAELQKTGCRFPEAAPTPDVVASPEALEHLQAMGYVEPDDDPAAAP